MEEVDEVTEPKEFAERICNDYIKLLVDKETGVMDPMFDTGEVDKEYLWMTNTLTGEDSRCLPSWLQPGSWCELLLGEPDRRARFPACYVALSVFQAVVTKFVQD